MVDVWTRERVLAVVEKARQAGVKAGAEQLEKLKGEGDKWIIRDEGGREIDRMLDLCGGAYVVIDCRQPFYRVAKKMEDEKNHRNCGSFWVSKISPGAMFGIRGLTNRQEASVNTEAEEAVANTLRSGGIKVLYVHSYID